MKIIKILILLLIGISISACKESTANNNETKRADIVVKTELRFGKDGVESFKKYKPSLDNNYMQQVGMGFVHLRKADNLGTVRVYTESSSLDIPYVTSAMGTIFNRKTYQGIHKISIDSLLHKDEYATEQEAYRNYVKLIEELKSKGWKQFNHNGVARVSADDNLRYMKEHTGESVSALTILSFEDWKAINDKHAYILLKIYNSDISASISISRSESDFSNQNRDKKYKFETTFSFETFRYMVRNLISDSDDMSTEEFEEAYIQREKLYVEYRQEDENNVKEQGYRIDNNYQNVDYWKYAK